MATYTAFVYTAADETVWMDIWRNLDGFDERLMACEEVPVETTAFLDRVLWSAGFRRAPHDYWDVPRFPAYGDATCTLTTKVVKS